MARYTQNIFLSVLFIISFISLPSFQFMRSSNYSSSQEEQTIIHSSQGFHNFTIDTFLPSLVWLYPQLQLNISVNQTGQIQCFFSESIGPQFFSIENHSLSLTGNNLSQIFYLQLIPLITTLPGIYQFSLNITGAFSYNENFEIIYGLGVIPLFSFLAIIIILSLVILFKKSKGVKIGIKKEATKPDGYEHVVSTIAGKINCPKCRKTIDEGLTFCPECGERIPEFLRYNPPSGI